MAGHRPHRFPIDPMGRAELHQAVADQTIEDWQTFGHPAPPEIDSRDKTRRGELSGVKKGCESRRARNHRYHHVASSKQVVSIAHDLGSQTFSRRGLCERLCR